MQRPLLLLSLLALAACADKPTAAPSKPDQAPEPAAAAKPDPAPAPEPAAEPVDRSKDPAFVLNKDGDHYVGLVADRCPEGFINYHARRDIEPKLDGDKLILRLFDGGCPRWAGYAVVPGEGSPLPFRVCVDPKHNPCEALGDSLWSFDIGDALKKSGATAVAYDPSPAQ